jgi:hypothetical protein
MSILHGDQAPTVFMGNSKSVEGNLVGVQLPLPTPSKIPISSVESEVYGVRQ